MYCVDCGKEKTIFREGSCKDCYFKKHAFTQAPIYLDIPLCAHCGSFKYKSNWTNETFEEILKRYVKQQFTISDELKEVEFSFQYDTIVDVFDCRVTIQGTIENEPVKETHIITIRMKKNVCDVCSKMFGGYHEAILQIRPYKKKLSTDLKEKIKVYIESLVYSLQEQGNRQLFIADMGEEHGGLDFFLSDKQITHAICKKTQETFGGEITISSKNIGMKDGKQLFRMTYLLRLFPFHSGDFISLKKQVFYVHSFSQSKVRLIDLKNWKEQLIDVRELDHAVVHGGTELISRMILVSQTKNDVELMSQKTYNMLVLRKPKPLEYDVEIIPTVEIHQQRYIVPTEEIYRK